MGIAAAIDAIARELTLFAAAGLFAGGLDDLAIDLMFLVRLGWRGGERDPPLAGLPPAPPAARLAIAVAAWREAGVIGAMLTGVMRRLTGKVRGPGFSGIGWALSGRNPPESANQGGL